MVAFAPQADPEQQPLPVDRKQKQRQRKKTQEMLGALKTGDKVVTNAGIYGTINGFDGETVILKIAEQVKIRIARSAISQVETTEDAK